MGGVLLMVFHDRCVGGWCAASGMVWYPMTGVCVWVGVGGWMGM